MKRTSSWILALTAMFCLLPAGVAQAQSNQPSLADVARRKPVRKAKIVVTNDDIPPVPEPSKPPASAPNGTDETAASGSAAPSQAPAAGKAQLPPDKQAKLQELLNERANLEAVIKHLEKIMAERTDEPARTNLDNTLQHAKQGLDQKQKEIDQLRAATSAAPASPPAAHPGAAQPGTQAAPPN